MADVCVWDWAVDPVGQRRMDVATSLHERAFAWMTLADDRNLVEAWVAGTARHRRSTG
jgi:guanine deaminase